MEEKEVAKYLSKINNIKNKINKLEEEYEDLVDPEKTTEYVNFFNEKYGENGEEMFYVLTRGDYSLTDFDRIIPGYYYLITGNSEDIVEEFPTNVYLFKDGKIKYIINVNNNHTCVVATTLDKQFEVHQLGNMMLFGYSLGSDIDRMAQEFYNYYEDYIEEHSDMLDEDDIEIMNDFLDELADKFNL